MSGKSHQTQQSQMDPACTVEPMAQDFYNPLCGNAAMVAYMNGQQDGGGLGPMDFMDTGLGAARSVATGAGNAGSAIGQTVGRTMGPLALANGVDAMTSPDSTVPDRLVGTAQAGSGAVGMLNAGGMATGLAPAAAVAGAGAAGYGIGSAISDMSDSEYALLDLDDRMMDGVYEGGQAMGAPDLLTSLVGAGVGICGDILDAETAVASWAVSSLLGEGDESAADAI
jgi:hypothetical protein